MTTNDGPVHVPLNAPSLSVPRFGSSPRKVRRADEQRADAALQRVDLGVGAQVRREPGHVAVRARDVPVEGHGCRARTLPMRSRPEPSHGPSLRTPTARTHRRHSGQPVRLGDPLGDRRGLRHGRPSPRAPAPPGRARSGRSPSCCRVSGETTATRGHQTGDLRVDAGVSGTDAAVRDWGEDDEAGRARPRGRRWPPTACRRRCSAVRRCSPAGRRRAPRSWPPRRGDQRNAGVAVERAELAGRRIDGGHDQGIRSGHSRLTRGERR